MKRSFLMPVLIAAALLAGCQGQAGPEVIWQTVEVPVTIIAVQTVEVPMTILVPYTVEVPVTVEVEVPITVLVPATQVTYTPPFVSTPNPTPKSVPPPTPSQPKPGPTPTDAPPAAVELDPYYTVARAQNVALFDILSALSGLMSGYRTDPNYLPPYANIVVQRSRVDGVRTMLASTTVPPELQPAHDLMIQACDRLELAVGYLLDGKRTEYLDRAYESNVQAKAVLDAYRSE